MTMTTYQRQQRYVKTKQHQQQEEEGGNLRVSQCGSVRSHAAL